MIHLTYSNIRKAAEAHFNAVVSYVGSMKKEWIDSLYSDIRTLMPGLPAQREGDVYDWLRDFILADVDTLDRWVANDGDKLLFTQFRKLYANRFANGNDNFVDKDNSYNAFTLLDMIDFHVCPYCEDEYFDVVEIDGKKKRTCDFDHFHAKSLEKYPALAMCFYNLVPSGKCCNFIKNDEDVSANPYSADIENYSRFYQDTPPGKILESLGDDEIRVKLDVKGKMIRNESKLGIEQRYNNRTEELRRLFRIKRDMTPENIEQMVKIGIKIELIKYLLGRPYPEERGNSLHHKLRHDITGY